LNLLEGFEVYKDYRVLIKNSNDKYYYPDFVLKEKKTGLLIDLEIDEPYVEETGAPIHYLEHERYLPSFTIDKDRNDYFIDNQWIVIRLAEQQVFQHPNLCIKLIEDTIRAIKSLDLQEIHVSKEFEVKKWSKEEIKFVYRILYKTDYF